MSEEDNLPNISTVFDFPTERSNNHLYRDAIKNILSQVLPKNIFAQKEPSPDILNHQREQFHACLPIFETTLCSKVPANMSFFVVSKYRSNSFRFFFEMIGHWLVPGKRLNVVMIYAGDFRIPQIGPGIFTACEVMIHVDNHQELEQIRRNLPIIETEVKLGIESSYYARRILEIKGLTADAKTALIQEYIAYLMSRKPNEFDYDILTEMQHVLVICKDEFKSSRDCRHLSRIISVHYLFRKALRESVKVAPEKRHLSLKLFRAVLTINSLPKPVLGVLVGVNFLREKEVFEKKHLMNAIQNYIPNAQAVENSFFANRRGSEHVCTLYLELEKANGEDFTSEEINVLRRELPTDLKDRIEHLMHPVFMPRNEEEIMRNILSLSSQIKYLRDIPQVFISFDEQTHANLFFTIILVRVMKPGSSSVQEMFKNTGTFLEYMHDRCKTVGFLRKKYTKEATVFRVKIPKDQFLRRDHSIDLYKARQCVVLELLRIVGEFRDFNGGMISKQNELLCALRSQLGGEIKYNDLLLENFFYSLIPVIMRTVLELVSLKVLFIMLLEAIEQPLSEGMGCMVNIMQDPNFVYILIKSEQRGVKEDINKALLKFHLQSSDLANSYVQVYDIHYIGYIYRCDDPVKQKVFCQMIEGIVAIWGEKKMQKIVLS